MTPLLGRPGEYTVLEIAISEPEPPSAAAEVSFRLVGRGEPTNPVKVTVGAVGLPDAFDRLLAMENPPLYTLPDDVGARLRADLAQFNPEGEPIYVDLMAPARRLATVAWEMLLLPVANGPILRAPHLPMKPVVCREQARVAVCINIPPEAGLRGALGVLGLLVHYRRAVPSGVLPRIFLFLGPELAREAGILWSYLARTGLLPFIEVLDVTPAQRELEFPGAREEPSPARVRHPWLRAILKRVEGRGIDVVQVVAPAALHPERAALSLAYRPSEGERGDAPTLPVGPGEFDLFLTQIGAWAVDFYPLGTAWSTPALRVFAEELSWLNPGAITVHHEGSGGAGLAATLNVHTGHEPVDAVQLGNGVSIHDTTPGFVEWSDRPQIERDALEYLTLARDTRLRLATLENGTAAGWVLAVQRHLERRVALLLRDDFLARVGREADFSELYGSRRMGVENGLRSVADAVFRHLQNVGFDSAVNPEFGPPEVQGGEYGE